jgi:cellulose synthase/poly-beta-1,6-N-acetylglucosamine synthase-like glycosyltransferase
VQRIQWVEYLFAIYLRKMMAFINCIYVVPGPGGMYKTEIIKTIGGFDEKNLTEDMEIAFRLQKKGYIIENSVNAFVDTIAPPTLIELIKQRIRWYTGFYDNIKQYRFFVLNPKHGSLGMYMLPMSIVWVGVLFYTMIKLFGNAINAVETPLRTILLTGFHFDILWKRFLESLYFQPTFMTWFATIFFVISIAIIIISVWTGGEKLDLKKKYANYLVYMVTYAFFVSVFWFASLAYIVVRNRTKERIRW